ncbi:hypothetical protein [Desulfonatronovibrio magnus]|uniref:hypothetical protein n=1 Tax=Desulfonatronovibrio magnus TaxID=698827 RepID=UPI0005EB2569|nr:hypothetical protein [Desulfonatronovibrio magnus]
MNRINSWRAGSPPGNDQSPCGDTRQTFSLRKQLILCPQASGMWAEKINPENPVNPVKNSLKNLDRIIRASQAHTRKGWRK